MSGERQGTRRRGASPGTEGGTRGRRKSSQQCKRLAPVLALSLRQLLAELEPGSTGAGSLHRLPAGGQDGEARQRHQMGFALQPFAVPMGLSGRILRSSPPLSPALLPLAEVGGVPAGEGRWWLWPGPSHLWAHLGDGHVRAGMLLAEGVWI